MAESSHSETHTPGLIRQIGLWSCVAVVVGSTIGSGIFKSPADVATKVPGPVPMLLVWALAGLFVLCGALTLGEVGGAFPYSGGLYVFIREGFGRLPAFLFGWAQLVLIRPSSVGAVAIVFGQYPLQLLGVDQKDERFPLYSAIVGILAIIAVSIANIRGVKFGARIQNLTAFAKTLGIIVLIVLAFAIGLPKNASTNFSDGAALGAVPISAYGLALVSVLWAYDGWADASFIGGEVLNPRKNLPRAILIGTILVIVVYILANVAYLSVFSTKAIGDSKIIASDTMFALVGDWGRNFIIATVMISTFGVLNGTMLTSPRIFFALAEDKLFSEKIGVVHPKFGTPYVSIVLTGSLGVLYVIVATALSKYDAFGTLTDAFVISMVPFYALSVGSVFVFRGREKRRKASAVAKLPDSLVDPLSPGHPEAHPHAYDPPVHTPLYPVTPALFILSTVFLLVNALLDSSSRIPTVITLAILLAGIPVYSLVIRKKVAS